MTLPKVTRWFNGGLCQSLLCYLRFYFLIAHFNYIFSITIIPHPPFYPYLSPFPCNQRTVVQIRELFSFLVPSLHPFNHTPRPQISACSLTLSLFPGRVARSAGASSHMPRDFCLNTESSCHTRLPRIADGWQASRNTGGAKGGFSGSHREQHNG